MVHIEQSQLTQNHPLEFAWIELTNMCNLQCSHCYSESSPFSADNDRLSRSDYLRILDELRDIGCKQIQFIGGEPTLNRDLPKFIKKAYENNFEFIEVFSNLMNVSDELWSIFKDYNIALATSFYSFDRLTHNSVTKSNISYDKTLASIKKALQLGLKIRVGFIEMEENKGQFEKTKSFLQELGVEYVGHDRVREIGRANSSHQCDMGELCGSCAGNIISIGSDGVVAPCNMSKQWAVGSVIDGHIKDIIKSDKISNVRSKIDKAVKENSNFEINAVCDPKTCSPYGSCCPSTQQCNPCSPNGCTPCFPKG